MLQIDLALVICKQGKDEQRIVASALKCGLTPICCSNLAEARMLLPQETFKIVLCNEVLSDGDFRAVLRDVDKSDPQMPVIVLGRFPDWDAYLDALGAGAFDYIVCPLNPAEATKTIWLALAETAAREKQSHAGAKSGDQHAGKEESEINRRGSKIFSSISQ